MTKNTTLDYSLKEILDIKMQTNDADATTIGDYLVKLLATLWIEGESFSAKRPFGNSGWEDEIYSALAKAGVIPCEWHDEEILELKDCDYNLANKLIRYAIESLYKP